MAQDNPKKSNYILNPNAKEFSGSDSPGTSSTEVHTDGQNNAAAENPTCEDPCVVAQHWNYNPTKGPYLNLFSYMVDHFPPVSYSDKQGNCTYVLEPADQQRRSRFLNRSSRTRRTRSDTRYNNERLSPAIETCISRSIFETEARTNVERNSGTNISEGTNKQNKQNKTQKSVPNVVTEHSALDEFLLSQPVAEITLTHGENGCVCGNSCESLAHMRSSFSEWFELLSFDCRSVFSKSHLKFFILPFELSKLYIIIKMFFNCAAVAKRKPEVFVNLDLLRTETDNIIKIYNGIEPTLLIAIRGNENVRSIISIGFLYMKGSVTCTYIQWLQEQMDGLECDFQKAFDKITEKRNYVDFNNLIIATSKWLIQFDLRVLFPECFPNGFNVGYNTNNNDNESIETVVSETLRSAEKAVYDGFSKQNVALEECVPKRSITASFETLDYFRLETDDEKGPKNLYRDNLLKSTAHSSRDTLEEDRFDIDINDTQKRKDHWINTDTSVRQDVFETSHILDPQDASKLDFPNKNIFEAPESKSPAVNAELVMPLSTVGLCSPEVSSYTSTSSNKTEETKPIKSKKQKTVNIGTKEIQTTFMEHIDKKESYCDVLKHKPKSVVKPVLVISDPILDTHSNMTRNLETELYSKQIVEEDFKNDITLIPPPDQPKRKKKTKAQKKAELIAALQEEENIKPPIEFVEIKEENALTELFKPQVEDQNVEKPSEETSKKISSEKKNVMKQMLTTINLNKNKSRNILKKRQADDKMSFDDNPLYKKALIQYVTKNELVSELDVKDIESYSLGKRKKYSSSSSVMNQQVRKRIKEFQRLWMENQSDLQEKEEPSEEKTPEKLTRKEKKRTKYIERQTVKSSNKQRRSKDEKKSEETEQDIGEIQSKEKNKKKINKKKFDETDYNSAERRKIRQECLVSSLDVKPKIHPVLGENLLVVEYSSLPKETRKKASVGSITQVNQPIPKRKTEQESQTQVKKPPSDSVQNVSLQKNETDLCREQYNEELKPKGLKQEVGTTKHHPMEKCKKAETHCTMSEIKKVVVPDKRIRTIDAQRQREMDAPSAVLKKRASRQYHKERAELERIADEIVTVLRIRICNSFAYIKQVKATPEKGAEIAYKYMCGNGYSQEVGNLLRTGPSAAAIRPLLTHHYNLFHGSIRSNSKFMLLEGCTFQEEDLQFSIDQLESVDEEISILEKINTAIGWVITSCESTPQYFRDFGTWKQFSQRLKGNGNLKDESLRKCAKRFSIISIHENYALIEKFITEVYIHGYTIQTYESLQSILKSHNNITRLWNNLASQHDFDYIHFFFYHVHEMFMHYWITANKKYDNNYNEMYIEKLHILHNKIVQAEKQMKPVDESLGVMWFWNYYIRSLIGNNHCEPKLNKEQISDLYSSSSILKGLPFSKLSKLSSNEKQIVLRNKSSSHTPASTATECLSDEDNNSIYLMHHKAYPKFKKVAKIMAPILEEVYKVVPDKDYLHADHTEVSINECSQQVNDVSNDNDLVELVIQEYASLNNDVKVALSKQLPESEENPGDVNDISSNELQEPEPVFANNEDHTEDTTVCDIVLEMKDHKNECITFNTQDLNTSDTHLSNVNDNIDNPQTIKEQNQLSENDDQLKTSSAVDIDESTQDDIKDSPTIDIDKSTSNNIEQIPTEDTYAPTPGNIKDNPTVEVDKSTSHDIKDNPTLEINKSILDNIEKSPMKSIDKSTFGDKENQPTDIDKSTPVNIKQDQKEDIYKSTSGEIEGNSVIEIYEPTQNSIKENPTENPDKSTSGDIKHKPAEKKYTPDNVKQSLTEDILKSTPGEIKQNSVVEVGKPIHDDIKDNPIEDTDNTTPDSIEQRPAKNIAISTPNNIKQDLTEDADKTTLDIIKQSPTKNINISTPDDKNSPTANIKSTPDNIKPNPTEDIENTSQYNIEQSSTDLPESSNGQSSVNNKSTGTLTEAIKSCISSFLYRPLKSLTKPKKQTPTNIQQESSTSLDFQQHENPEFLEEKTDILDVNLKIKEDYQQPSKENTADMFLKYFFPNYYTQSNFKVSESIRKIVREVLDKIYNECIYLQKTFQAKESKLLYTIIKNDVMYESYLNIGVIGLPFVDQKAELLNEVSLTSKMTLDVAGANLEEINAASSVSSFESPKNYSSMSHTQDPWWDPPETYGNQRNSISENVSNPFSKPSLKLSKVSSPKTVEHKVAKKSDLESLPSDEIPERKREKIIIVQNDDDYVATSPTTLTISSTEINNTVETSFLQNSSLEYSSELSECLAHTSGTSKSTPENTSSEWETPAGSPSQVDNFYWQTHLNDSLEFLSPINQEICPIHREQYLNELEKHLLFLNLLKSLKIMETIVLKIRNCEEVTDTADLKELFISVGSTLESFLGDNARTYEYLQFLFGGITNYVKNFFADWIFEKYMNNIQTKNIQHWDDDQLSTGGKLKCAKSQVDEKETNITNEKKQQGQKELKKRKKRRKNKATKEVKVDRDPREEKLKLHEGRKDELKSDKPHKLTQESFDTQTDSKKKDTKPASESQHKEESSNKEVLKDKASTQKDSSVDTDNQKSSLSADVRKKQMKLRDEWHRIFFYRPYILRQALKLLMAIQRCTDNSNKEPPQQQDTETPGPSNNGKQKIDSSRLAVSKTKQSRASLRRKIGKDVCNKPKKDLDKCQENILFTENQIEDQICRLVKHIDLEKLRKIPKCPVENPDLLFSNECGFEAELSMYSLIKRFRRRYFRLDTIEVSSKFTSQYLAMIKAYQSLEKKRFLQSYELKTASNQMEPNAMERKSSIIPLHEVGKTDFGTHVVYHRIGYQFKNTGTKSVANIFMYDFVEKPKVQGFIVKGQQVKYVFNSDKFPKKFHQELQKSYKMQKVVEQINKQFDLNVNDPSFWGKLTDNKVPETLVQFDEFLDNCISEEVMDSHAYFY